MDSSLLETSRSKFLFEDDVRRAKVRELLFRYVKQEPVAYMGIYINI